MLSPRQIFDDNIRPADLLLKVFRLLEHDALNTEKALLCSLRELVKADEDESLLVILNGNLLRQAVVTASTALETYLPILLRNNLPEVIRLRGRDFVPRNDEAFKNQFKELKFDLDETVRILVDPDPLFVANKMISSLNFSYLNGRRGIHITGVLLALDNPWQQIAHQLGREEDEIKKTLDSTVKRRNDIVHRADRSQDDPVGPAQEIGFPLAKQAVETIRVVCLALDDLVTSRLDDMKHQAAAAASQTQGTA
jgi:hypothetical protein